MAVSFNKVLIMGNLTRDPELRYIPSGQAVTNFSVAVNRIYSDQNGAKKEEVTFLRVVVWGKRAEVCNEYLRKGSPVFVEGRLQSRNWEAQDGSKRNTVEINAQSVQFLPSARKNESQQNYGGASYSPSGANTNNIDENMSDYGAMNIPDEELTPDSDKIVPF